MRVLTVIGNRPQFIKAAAVSSRLRALGEEVTVHTGQHYDAELSQVFFDELELPPPEHLLGIGGGTNTAQTARMLAALEPLLADERARRACSSTATRTRRSPARSRPCRRGIPVAHVEAGMRSFDRAMPEEVNRVAHRPPRDAAAVPVADGGRQPARASRSPGAVELVGDVMVDVAQLLQPAARARDERRCAPLRRRARRLPARDRAPRRQRRRPGAPARARRRCCCALPLPVVLPLHPRTRARLEAAGLLGALEAPRTCALAPPLGYLDFTALLCNARAVADRLRRRAEGGLPRRRAVRDAARAHEWVETVEAGWNVLVDLDADAALAALERAAAGRAPAALRRRPRRRARRRRARPRSLSG